MVWRHRVRGRPLARVWLPFVGKCLAVAALWIFYEPGPLQTLYEYSGGGKTYFERHEGVLWCIRGHVCYVGGHRGRAVMVIEVSPRVTHFCEYLTSLRLESEVSNELKNKYGEIWAPGGLGGWQVLSINLTLRTPLEWDSFPCRS